MAATLASTLRDELARLLAPLTISVLVPGGVIDILRAIGRSGRAETHDALATELQRLAKVVDEIRGLDDDALDSWEGIGRILHVARDLVDGINGLEAVVNDPTLASQVAGLGADVLSWLIGLHLRTNYPRLFRTAALLTLVTPAEEQVPAALEVEDGQVQRLPWSTDRLERDRIDEFIRDPRNALRTAYLPNDLTTAHDAHDLAARLFPRLHELARELGLSTEIGALATTPAPATPPPTDSDAEMGDLGSVMNIDDEGTTDPAPPPPPPDPREFELTHLPRFILNLPGLPSEDGQPVPARIGLVATASSAEHPGGLRGLIIAPWIGANWTETRGPWRLELKADGEVAALVVGPGGVSIPPISTPATGGRAALSLERLGDDGPALLFGSATGSRLEIGSLLISLGAEATTVREAVVISIHAGSSQLVLAAGDGDGFLKRILPSDGIRAKFDVGASLSSDRGLQLWGSTGLSATIPIHEQIGPLSIESITVDIAVHDDGIPIGLGADLAIELGPITAVALGIGLAAVVAFPEHGGNLGPLNFDLGFKPPHGIGLGIDGGGFSGGGFIDHDASTGRYTGILDVGLSDLRLTGVGILETRMPDGSEGFSLFVSITARFQAIQLGLGFTLNGVGGLIGIHRTVRIDVIRAGLKDASLSNILFPDNPIANAAAIIADIERVFPSQQGRFVLGPMFRIGWGTPTLITADVGLVIELPAPIRIALVGVVRCNLPHAHAPILAIQANFLGTIELERGRMSFDASLFDSHLLSFTLDGDVAARFTVLPFPNYLLSVGGFHPAYTPPPMDLPSMRRLTINLLGGDNPRLRAELYFAQTSNSFQMGGSVELYAAVSKFNIYGFLGFDLLIQILPTRLAADIKATLAVRVGDDPIMSVGVEFALEGPRPWHAKGSAHFKVCGLINYSKHFDRTWGEPGEDVLPEVDVLPLVLNALDAQDSWRARLPTDVHAVAMLKDTDATLVDPAGTLMITERIVPLKLTIARFSSAKPRDATRFEITKVMSDADELHTTDITEEFAPAEFFELTDAEKLSRPSFEQYPSGVAIDGTDALIADDLVVRDVEYEEIIVDRVSPGRATGKRGIGEVAFADLLRANATSRSAFARERVGSALLAGITAVAERYAIVSTTDLRSPANAASCASYGEALEELRRITTATPALAGTLQIVTSEELAA